VSEKLFEERRQAGVLILREIHSNYIPVGVWNVRETVRNMLKEKPEVFDSLEKSLSYISSKLEIPLKIWIENSKILKDFYHQKDLKEFLRG
ncbi:MAG: Nre family DNA repair protein, partial [Candidatus Aenigmatarchaeota archaeon]